MHAAPEPGPAAAAPPTPAEDVAAGVVAWRLRKPRRGTGTLELLLVRSARHGSWGFPKGHVEPGEPLPVCAAREALEETGIHVVLGRPMPAQRYVLPDGRPKVVHFWTARSAAASDGEPVAQLAEVDEVRWVGLDAAADLLTYAEDLGFLDVVRGRADDGTLDTRPVVVVRHAKARPRAQWSRADADRPLLALGKQQAAALVPLLACWRPTYLLSSPWQRCLQTVRPYATSLKATVRVKGGLSEAGHRRHPGKAARHLERLLDRDDPALLCTHRPVLPRLLASLAEHCPDDVGAALPARDPYLDPAEVLVLHLRRGGRPGRPVVLAAERHRAR